MATFKGREIVREYRRSYLERIDDSKVFDFIPADSDTEHWEKFFLDKDVPFVVTKSDFNNKYTLWKEQRAFMPKRKAGRDE